VVESMLLGSSLLKVMDGGWFPLLIGAVIIFILSTWMDGRGLLAKRHGAGSLTEEEFLGALSERHLTRVAGTAVFLTAQTDRVPFALLHNMRHNRVLHERIVMTTLTTEARPFVPESERVEVRQFDRGFSRLIVHYGFADEPDLPAAMRELPSASFGDVARFDDPHDGPVEAVSAVSPSGVRFEIRSKRVAAA